MSAPELKVVAQDPRDMNLEELLVHYEPAVVAAQFNQAIKRLREVFDDTVAHDLQGGRRLIELVALVAGERRKKVIEVDIDRRAAS